MAITDIEYGDRTWNPLTGCSVVSEGCKNCWATTMAKVGKKKAGRVLDGWMWSEKPRESEARDG